MFPRTLTARSYRVVTDGRPARIDVDRLHNAMAARLAPVSTTEALDSEDPERWGWTPTERVGRWIAFSEHAWLKKIPSATLSGRVGELQHAFVLAHGREASTHERGELRAKAARELLRRCMPTTRDRPVVIDVEHGRVWLFEASPSSRAELLDRVADLLAPVVTEFSFEADGLTEWLAITRPRATLPPDLPRRFCRFLVSKARASLCVHHPKVGAFRLELAAGMSFGDGNRVGNVAALSDDALDLIVGDAPSFGVTCVDLYVTDADTDTRWNVRIDGTGCVLRHTRDDRGNRPERGEISKEIEREMRGCETLATLSQLLWRAFDAEIVTQVLADVPCFWPGAPEGDVAWSPNPPSTRSVRELALFAHPKQPELR